MEGRVLEFTKCLQILLFLNSSFTIHLCGQRVGGHKIGHFLWMSDPLGAYERSVDQLHIRFIFNNYSSLVNSVLHLVASCHSEVKKNKASCHAVADK